MIESVRDDALAAGLTTRTDWDRGIADLRRTADDGGTFHYTFFKALAVNPTRCKHRGERRARFVD